MAEKSTPRAFAVTIVHGDGPFIVNTCIAPSPEAAAVITLRDAYKQNVPAEEPTGVAVMELRLEWLRTAVRALEVGDVKAQVLSLVPQSSLGPVAPEPMKPEQAAQVNLESQATNLPPEQQAVSHNIGADNWPPFPPVA